MMDQLGMGLLISLKDAFSQNAARIRGSVTSLDSGMSAASKSINASVKAIGAGIGMMGAGTAMMAGPAALVAGTMDTKKALGELASEGVKDLRAIEDAATRFTNQWAGYTKAEFIGAAYTIKGGLSQLSDAAVGTATELAALTAKATKSSIAEMAQAFTQGYGIFKSLDAEMSDQQWFSKFSGALSKTIETFNVEGPDLIMALNRIGQSGVIAGASMQEQLAVIGGLKGTMKGEQAGESYRAFLRNIYDGGRKLGIAVTDTNGMLLSTVDIVDNLKNKFPQLGSAMGAPEAILDRISKAFGDVSAMQFVGAIAKLPEEVKRGMKDISAAMNEGAGVPTRMSKAMDANIWGLFTVLKQRVGNLFQEMGNAITPWVSPFINAASTLATKLQNVAKAAAPLVGIVGGVTFVLGGLVFLGGAVVTVLGGVALGIAGIAAALPIVLPLLPAIFTGIGVGAAVVAALSAATGALYLAWKNNFAGIADTVRTTASKVSLTLRGLGAMMSNLHAGKTGTGLDVELRRQLNAAGLIGVVNSIFGVYERVYAFMAGMFTAYGAMVRRAFGIVEPAVKSVISAWMSLGEAVGSIVQVFTGALGMTHVGPWRALGQAVGFVFGLFANGAAYAIRGILFPMTVLMRVLATGLSVVRPILSGIVTVVAWVVGGIWRALGQAVGFVSGIMSTAAYAITLPFRAVWAVLSGWFSGIKSTIGRITEVFYTAFGPAIRDIRTAWNALFYGQGTSQLSKSIISLKPAFDWIVKVLRGVSYFAGEIFGKYVGNAIIGAINIVAWFARAIAFTISGLVGAFVLVRDTIYSVFSSVSGVFGGMYDLGSGMISSIIEGIKGGGASIRDTLLSYIPGGKFMFDKAMAFAGFSDTPTQSAAAAATTTTTTQSSAPKSESAVISTLSPSSRTGSFVPVRRPYSAAPTEGNKAPTGETTKTDAFDYGHLADALRDSIANTLNIALNIDGRHVASAVANQNRLSNVRGYGNAQ